MNKEEALSLYKKAKDPRNALDLFKRASKIRDENIGKKLWFSSGGGAAFACHIMPRCSYCSFYSNKKLQIPLLVKTIEKVEELGVSHFHISGGTNLNKGYDEQILELVNAIKAKTKVDIEVNLGPSFQKQTLIELQKLGVESITSSLECFNPKLFEEAKPGDSLERRKALLQDCDELGISSNSMILLGLGESDEDIIDHLFYLQSLKYFKKLRLSRFMAFKGTLYEDKIRCSPWKVALVTALARILMPKVQISLAAGNDTNDMPLWYLAGGGNDVFSIMMSQVEPKYAKGVDIIKISEDICLVDRRELVKSTLEGMCEMP